MAPGPAWAGRDADSRSEQEFSKAGFVWHHLALGWCCLVLQGAGGCSNSRISHGWFLQGSDEEGDLQEPRPEVESWEADAVSAITDEDQRSTVGEEIPNEIIGNLEVLLLESYSLILSMVN